MRLDEASGECELAAGRCNIGEQRSFCWSHLTVSWEAFSEVAAAQSCDRLQPGPCFPHLDPKKHF